MDFQFRIHLAYVDVSGFVLSQFEKCAQGFVFEHEADEEVTRTHIHGYVFGCTIKPKTFSEQIKTKFNLKGNSDFSVSEKCGRKDPRPIDISGAYEYGSKWDTIRPAYLKIKSPDLLDELRSYARKMGSFHKIASKSAPTTEIVVLKEIKVKQKPTQYQHCISVVNLINQLHPDLFNRPLDEQRRLAFEVTYRYFQQNEMFMGKYKQLDFFDMVLMKLNCEEYKKLLYGDFLRRTSNYAV